MLSKFQPFLAATNLLTSLKSPLGAGQKPRLNKQSLNLLGIAQENNILKILTPFTVS